MSNTDRMRLPRIAQSVRVVEIDDMGSYSFGIPQNLKRVVVQYDRAQKREMRQSGSGRKAQIVDLDTQEQIKDALLAPAYEGPVGTHAGIGYLPEWERALLHTCSIMCLVGMNEVRLSNCEFGCKVYATACGELILHSRIYGHATFSVEHMPVVIIEPVVSRRTYLSNDPQPMTRVGRPSRGGNGIVSALGRSKPSHARTADNKVRVSELAKEAGLTVTAIVNWLRSHGEYVIDGRSTVVSIVAQTVRDNLIVAR